MDAKKMRERAGQQRFELPTQRGAYEASARRDIYAAAHRELGIKPAPIKTADMGGFFGGGPDHYNNQPSSRAFAVGMWSILGAGAIVSFFCVFF